MRIAIRILCIRDGIHEKRSNPLLKFTSEQISEFLNEIFVKRDRKCVKLLREHIIKWNIDGLIFYAYKDGKEFQSDFHDLDIDGIYFRKAIIMRNERFKVPTHTYLPFVMRSKKPFQNQLQKKPEAWIIVYQTPNYNILCKKKVLMNCMQTSTKNCFAQCCR